MDSSFQSGDLVWTTHALLVYSSPRTGIGFVIEDHPLVSRPYQIKSRLTQGSIFIIGKDIPCVILEVDNLFKEMMVLCNNKTFLLSTKYAYK